ncbi:kinase domain [Thalictrum thalictroides]|uniref:Kinase domain n=1 Tax=Thalictrum thalictroides TaxID=46969 RepID=A0A7J6W0N8_THATH|nr:kinase domain [Thalictrum thalictroides]
MTVLLSFCVFSLVLIIETVSSQQFYDKSECTSISQVPGSNYICKPVKYPCQTFIVYRTRNEINSLLAISTLFKSNYSQLLTLNYLNQSVSDVLPLGREIIIPINCSCAAERFSQAIFKYNSSNSNPLYNIACGVFEGLLKAQTLADMNQNYDGNSTNDVELTVPIRCACPDRSDIRKGVNYLVTYPIVERDETRLIASKFGIAEDALFAANNLEPFSTIFPQTTLLIPTTEIPAINLEVTRPVQASPGPKISIPLKDTPRKKMRRKSYIVIGLIAAISLLILVCAFGLFIHIRRVCYPLSFQPLSARSSQMSSFSPDFLDGMAKLKHSLLNFSLEELQLATGDFCDASAVGSSVYHGRIGGSHLAIERMESEDAANLVVDILTKINHLNIVRLEGFCYETARPYLVFEFAANGCLRDYLSDKKLAGELIWKHRMQIAFDVAVGIHYIHHCTNPAYVHRNISSRSVLITTDGRAKITGFKWAKSLIDCEDKNNLSVTVGHKGYLAPEYIDHGLSSPKVDIFALGVVLLELISNKEAVMDTCYLKDSVEFLSDGVIEGSSGCLEKLKEFIDPSLDGNYPLGDALCLTLLAKGCVEKDPNHRPNMNDVLKALSRIV